VSNLRLPHVALVLINRERVMRDELAKDSSGACLPSSDRRVIFVGISLIAAPNRLMCSTLLEVCAKQELHSLLWAIMT
jgi:hypothetical protein